MKRKFTIIASVLLAASSLLFAQNSYVHRVLVVNEGHYDYFNSLQTVPVTAGVYNPSNHSYTVFDTIQNARFATNVIVDGAGIYVAADSFLIRYDANTYQRLATATVRGIRKIAVWNNQLLISRGEYMENFNSYFQVYDKNNLNLLYELPVAYGPQYASEGIVVKDDIAYVAVGNGFDWGNEVGLIGRVDLTGQTYLNEINLGIGGTNPEGMFLHNNVIYTVNNTNYSTASISNVDIVTQTATTTGLFTATGCGASGFTPGYVMFQVSGGNQVERFSTSTSNIHDTLMINRNIYGMATDTLNNLMYVGETDYTSYGKIIIYDMAGAAKDSFDVSVSPGNIAFDVRTSVVITEADNNSSLLSVYPNPATNQVTVFANKKRSNSDTFILTDITGRAVMSIASGGVQSFTIDLHLLSSGVYYLRSLSNPEEKVKIIKQ